MRQDIILVANEGQTIPTTLSEKAVKEHPHAMGVAYLEESGLYAGSETAGLTLEDFEGHQQEFINTKRIYHFSKAEGEIQQGDLQPFSILKVGDENVAIAFIEGKFDVPNDGQLTDASVLAGTVLKDILDDAWEISQQNVEKLEARMKGKTFMGEMERLCKPFKATICFMLSNGSVMTHSKSETKAEAPWGFSTSMLGLKEGVFPAAEAAPEVVPEKKKIGGIKPATSVPAVAPAPTIAPSPSVGTVINKGPTAQDLTGKAATAVASPPLEMVWAVPQNGMKEHKLEEWYKKFNNDVIPENWKQRPPIQMSKERAHKMGSVRALGPVKEGEKTYKAFTEIDSKKLQTAATEPAKPVVTEAPKEIVPIYPIDEVKEIDKLIQNNKMVLDPANLALMEKNYPTFWKAHGLTPDKTRRWPLALRVQINQKSPLQGAHAWQNADYQCELLTENYLELVDEKEKVDKELAELKASMAVTAEQPKKRIGGIRR